MGTDPQRADMPYDDREEDGKFQRKYTDEMVLDAIRELGKRTGTGDIADELGCSNRLALTRLRSLEEQNAVSGFPVGNTFLWEIEDAR